MAPVPTPDQHDVGIVQRILESSVTWIAALVSTVFYWIVSNARRKVVDETANAVVDRLTQPDKFSGVSPLAQAIRYELRRMNHGNHEGHDA